MHGAGDLSRRLSRWIDYGQCGMLQSILWTFSFCILESDITQKMQQAMVDQIKTSALDHKGDAANPEVKYFRPRYVRSLDGIRGVLILMVVQDHLDLLRHSVGFIGVNCFFVLSGFLITWLLVSEWNDLGTIKLKDFYYRRALRLFPALFVMLALFALYTCLVSPPRTVARDFHYILWALFYFTNWGQVLGCGDIANHLAHTWSLSIEEQFYLLWAPMLLLLLHRTESKTSLLWWTVLAALCSVLIRAYCTFFGEAGFYGFWRVSRGLDARADSLLIGCAAGIIVTAQLLPRRRWLEWALYLAAAISIGGLIWVSWHEIYDSWMYYVGWFLASLFTAIIILHLVYSPRGMLHRIFEASPLVYVGIISYGLYIWHFPIFNIIHERYPNHWQFTAVAAALAATLLSYYLVERPCLRLKKKFSRIGQSVKQAETPVLIPADG
jgi:peptidoglycan/LPS O-acetylase OafA/YrhL